MKIVPLVFGGFFAGGLAMLAGGIYSVWHTRHFLQCAVAVQGVVVENVWTEDRSSKRDVTWDYYPRIRFKTAGGQELSFISDTGANPPSYKVNQQVTVVYDPERPADASIKSFGSLWALPVVLLGMGVAFVGPGTGLVLWKRANHRKTAWLHQNGRRIQAEFTRVELNTSLNVNGASPYRIVCQWLDPLSGEILVFHSGNIWYDPAHFIKGKELEVLVDPNNLRRYTVETSFLPKRR